MKKKSIVVIAIALIFLVSSLIVLLSLKIPDSYHLSQEQAQTIDTLGYPAQFVISYLPKGKTDVVRTEYWYYPVQKLEITFLDGTIYTAESYEPDAQATATSLKPEDFDLLTTLDQIETLMEGSPPEPLDFLPGFYEPGKIETYISSSALFVIESDFLTYFQTLGVVQQ